MAKIVKQTYYLGNAKPPLSRDFNILMTGRP